MAYFRCTGEGGAPVPTVSETVIFENGQWYNSDKVTPLLSPSGISDISIVDGKILYSGDTGISFSLVDTTKPWTLIVEYEFTSGSNYTQSGRCVIGADARLCMYYGTQRYSWHDENNIAANTTHVWVNGINSTGEGLFFCTGGNSAISRISAFIGISHVYYQ